MNENTSSKFIQNLQETYESAAALWTIDSKDFLVGSADLHNNWQDYKDFLFKGIDTKNLIALDFGCGIGRNIVLFHDRFARIDGADVSQIILEKAGEWIQYSGIALPNLYLMDKESLSSVPSNTYDVIFSTVCLQHICIYSVRYSIFKDMFRALKPGGYICHQMGFDERSDAVSVRHYFDDTAPEVNALPDVHVEDPAELENDLKSMGFINFQYDLRPTGPRDYHGAWIFFRAQKPNTTI